MKMEETNEDWNIRDVYIETCEEGLGKVERNRKEWLKTILGGRLRKRDN